MSKQKLFGKNLEDLADSGAEKPRTGKPEDKPLDKDGWKEEIRQAAKYLGFSENLDYNEILNRYFPLHSSGNDFTTIKGAEVYDRLCSEISEYIKANEKQFGLRVTEMKVYRADFVDKIKEIGDRQIKQTGSVNNNGILLDLGLRLTNDNLETISYITLVQHDEFNWRKVAEPSARTVYYVAK
jgi:hypothetical protein